VDAARQTLEQFGAWTMLDTPSVMREALSTRESARLKEAASSASAAPDVWRAADARLSAALRGGADEAPGGDPTSRHVKASPAEFGTLLKYSERAVDLARLETAVAAPSAKSARAANSAGARAVAACEVATARLLRADAAAFAQVCNMSIDGVVAFDARRDRLFARRCMSDLAPAAPLLDRHLATLEGAAKAEFERHARPFLDLAREYEASLAPPSLAPPSLAPRGRRPSAAARRVARLLRAGSPLFSGHGTTMDVARSLDRCGKPMSRGARIARIARGQRTIF